MTLEQAASEQEAETNLPRTYPRAYNIPALSNPR